MDKSTKEQIRRDRVLNRYTPIPESGCWIWDGMVNMKGYGKISINGNVILAHRYFYEQLRGPIPVGLFPDHLCRVPPCVNPAHLEIVTMRENTLRGIGPTARYAKATHCIHGHAFTEENTYYSNTPYGVRRKCYACTIRRDKEYRVRIRRMPCVR